MDFSNTIKGILSTNGSRLFLENVLSGVNNEHMLIDFLHRYTVFNGNFAGGVANLAGAFHVRNDLFRYSQEPIESCAHAGPDIASHIFFAAEDEYASRFNGARVTHRGLAQFLLRESLAFFAVSPQEFSHSHPLNRQTFETLQSVLQGYKIDKSNTEQELYDALGFHLGSEILADQEFNILDTYLRQHYPQLVDFLSKQENLTGQTAYDWIRVHTFVEEEHFNISVRAAEIVLETYCGILPKENVFQTIIDGFVGFAALQRNFFQHILLN